MPTLTATFPKAAPPPLAALHTDCPCADCGHVRPTYCNPHDGSHYCLDCLGAYIAWEVRELTTCRAGLEQLTQFQRSLAA